MLKTSVGAEIECKKGQILDLDGKCVKKVLFVRPERKSCPAPSVVNGEFVLSSSRLVEFYCNNDNNYVMVPHTEIAICNILGRWSKQVPSCLLPGCLTPPSPGGGEVQMEFENTVARFSCGEGLRLEGGGVLGCLDGTNWNGSFPTCEKCAPPPDPDGGKVTLELHGTVARFRCREGFELVGEGVLACLDGTIWNSCFPSCEKMVTVTPVAVGVTASQAVNKSFNPILLVIILVICGFK